jgi:hypothetical protein
MLKYKMGLAREGIDFQTEGGCVFCARYEDCMKELDREGIPHPDYTCEEFLP